MSTPEKQFSINLGVRLKKARGYRSQAEFARFLGINNQQTYARYETGERLPNAKVLHQMAQALGVEVGALLTDEPLRALPLSVREGAESFSSPRSLQKLIREISEVTGLEEEKVRSVISDLIRRGS